MPYIYIPDEYEVEKHNVELLEQIGQGNFGKVITY